MSSPDRSIATPRPRVGYVLKMYPRFSETFIVNEILALEDSGVDLEIFSLRPPVDGRFHEDLARVRAPVHYLPRRLKAGDVWATLRDRSARLPGIAAHLDELLAAEVDEAIASVEVALRVRESEITHLHAHFASVSTTVARLAARLAGVTFSFTAHAKDIFHEEVVEADLRVKLRDAAAVVTVSDYNVAHLAERFGVDADRVVRIYNGLDLDEFAFAGPRGRQHRVVAVGRLVEKKGFDDLLRAIALLKSDGHPVPLTLIGTGLEEERLRALTRDLGIGELVELTGALPQGQVRSRVASAAVLAAPCVVGSDGNRDGLPTVLLEALALGTPCVATPVTGTPEAIRHGETGLIVPERRPGQLADALQRLLGDPEERCRLAIAGRHLVEEEFNTRVTVPRLRHLLVGQMHPAPALPASRVVLA